MFSDFGSHPGCLTHWMYHSIRKCSPQVRHFNSFFCGYLTKFKGRHMLFVCLTFTCIVYVVCICQYFICICVHVCVNKFVYEPLWSVYLCVSMSV